MLSGKLERGQCITSGPGRAGGAAVCETLPDHVLGFSIFLLRSPTCSKEYIQGVSCLLPHQLGVRALVLRCAGGFIKEELPAPLLLCREMSRIPLAEIILERCPGSPRQSLFRTGCCAGSLGSR